MGEAHLQNYALTKLHIPTKDPLMPRPLPFFINQSFSGTYPKMFVGTNTFFVAFNLTKDNSRIKIPTIKTYIVPIS